MGYRIVSGIFVGLMLVISVLIPKHIVFAGDINANEAQLITAASGTFTYDGKTYRAYNEYVNMLKDYLMGDNIDLTSEQYQEAMSLMYSNVKNGIDQGYLYEVGSDEDIPTGPQSAYDEEAANVDIDEDESSTNADKKTEGSQNNGYDNTPEKNTSEISTQQEVTEQATEKVTEKVTEVVTEATTEEVSEEISEELTEQSDRELPESSEQYNTDHKVLFIVGVISSVVIILIILYKVFLSFS